MPLTLCLLSFSKNKNILFIIHFSQHIILKNEKEIVKNITSA